MRHKFSFWFFSELTKAQTFFCPRQINLKSLTSFDWEILVKKKKLWQNIICFIDKLLLIFNYSQSGWLFIFSCNTWPIVHVFSDWNPLQTGSCKLHTERPCPFQRSNPRPCFFNNELLISQSLAYKLTKGTQRYRIFMNLENWSRAERYDNKNASFLMKSSDTVNVFNLKALAFAHRLFTKYDKM